MSKFEVGQIVMVKGSVKRRDEHDCVGFWRYHKGPVRGILEDGTYIVDIGWSSRFYRETKFFYENELEAVDA